MKTGLKQHQKLPSKKQIDSQTNWIILVHYPAQEKIYSELPYRDALLARQKRIGGKKPDADPIVLDLPNTAGSHLSLASIETTITNFDLLTLTRKLFDEHKVYKPEQLGIVIAGFEKNDTERMAESTIAAVLASTAEMPRFKSRKKSRNSIKIINIYGVKIPHGFKQTFAEAEGNALARSLSMLPANKLTPTDYLKQIRQLARANKWKLEFFDTNALKKKKAGAFLAVAQGSPTADAGIVRLQYKPSSATRHGKLMLVGKGICYDTGGTNLKPANYMFGMHEDMQGSAIALGTLLALTRLHYKYPVECWMAIATNHIGPKAYKPNDVITAADGTTIEIVHTDAEGRMVLADTLILASRQKPKLIIDFATLTGGCIYSLGTAYSGVFTNKYAWIPTLVQAGRDSGERVWPFPLDEDYDKLIESEIADIKQCSRESGTDHILAARFLQRFVKNDTPWVHIDLSSSNRKGGLAHIPTDTTGFGVRYSLNLLLEKKLI
jgi:leucyl aminopeptidase